MRLDPLKPDLSVVLPCLNEEDTLGTCLQKLLKVSTENNFRLEVIVADNGSTDNSVSIASSFGARIVNVKSIGYGSALISGIKEAQAPFILMADADDSYDLLDTPKFYEALQKGYELVQGCRLSGGGGKIAKGAMPWSHKYIGNPMFTHLVQNWFKSPVNDVYCGMRAFTKNFYQSLNMKSQGMEFATEMIIKAANLKANTFEIPITLHKDGRIQHPPHLKTFRDGWKTLRFFFICAPAKLFLLPGIIMIILGLIGNFMGYNEIKLGTATLGIHTMLGSALFVICGVQAVLMHSLSNQLTARLNKSDVVAQKKINLINSKKVTGISFIMLIIGIMTWLIVFWNWFESGFSELDYSKTFKLVVPGTTLICLFFQYMFFSFFRTWLTYESSE